METKWVTLPQLAQVARNALAIPSELFWSIYDLTNMFKGGCSGRKFAWWWERRLISLRRASLGVKTIEKLDLCHTVVFFFLRALMAYFNPHYNILI